MRPLILSLLAFLTFGLSACSGLSQPESAAPLPFSTSTLPAQAATSAPAPTPTDDPSVLALLFPNAGSSSDLTRTDSQGMVTVEVTPLNLGTAADSLEFNVSLSTHSVDLSMDLAQIATLTTDTGFTVQATLWDGPRGGHHVAGKLSFPATQAGKSILEGAKQLTLTLTSIDNATRVFTWDTGAK